MRPRLALLLATSATVCAISSINELTAAINQGPVRAVGFLSRGNYDAIASVLPKSTADGGPLEVQIFADLEAIEAAVVSGEILAGLATSRPENEDGHLNEFPASLITMRAPMFKMGAESQQLREAIDAAAVRAIHAGEYERLESQYFASDKFDSVASFTCGVDPSKFPFPPSATATGLLAEVLSSQELKVGALGPSNWGYQGNYLLDPPSGFWPDYLNAVMAEFTKAYPGVVAKRVWNGTSVGVMHDVLEGQAHMTDIYWTVPAWFENRARSETFELGCTVLGTDSIFFAKNMRGGGLLPTWAVALLAVGGLLLLLTCGLVAIMVRKEKQGTPIFLEFKDPPKSIPPMGSGAV